MRRLERPHLRRKLLLYGSHSLLLLLLRLLQLLHRGCQTLLERRQLRDVRRIRRRRRNRRPRVRCHGGLTRRLLLVRLGLGLRLLDGCVALLLFRQDSSPHCRLLGRRALRADCHALLRLVARSRRRRRLGLRLRRRRRLPLRLHHRLGHSRLMHARRRHHLCRHTCLHRRIDASGLRCCHRLLERRLLPCKRLCQRRRRLLARAAQRLCDRLALRRFLRRLECRQALCIRRRALVAREALGNFGFECTRDGRIDSRVVGLGRRVELSVVFLNLNLEPVRDGLSRLLTRIGAHFRRLLSQRLLQRSAVARGCRFQRGLHCGFHRTLVRGVLTAQRDAQLCRVQRLARLRRCQLLRRTGQRVRARLGHWLRAGLMCGAVIKRNFFQLFEFHFSFSFG